MYDDEGLMKGSARSKWPSLGIYPWSKVLTLGNANGLVISKDQRGLLIRMYRNFDIAYVNGFVLGTPKFYIIDMNSVSHITVTQQSSISLPCMYIITLRPRQNGRHFADDTFKRIFLIENVRISIEISLKFVPKGDKPLSEPIMVRLLTHICVTRPQWVIQSSVSRLIAYKLLDRPDGFIEIGERQRDVWIASFKISCIGISKCTKPMGMPMDGMDYQLYSHQISFFLFLPLSLFIATKFHGYDRKSIKNSWGYFYKQSS